MRNPQETLDKLETILSDWRVLGRRAQLEAAMPTLDILVKHRVGYSDLAKLLGKSELEITADALRQALSRWRRKQGSLASPGVRGSIDTAVQQSCAEEPIAAPSILHSAAHAAAKGSAAADPLSFRKRLEEIKKEHINLEALKRQTRSP